MSREIKFRGKRINNGEWVYGDLIHYSTGKVSIRNVETWLTIDVDPATVGQYTGLCDKNDKEIYEGDIVKRTCDLIGAPDDDFIGIVKFECAAFLLESLDGKDGRYLWDDVQELEILGNIHDNPELLEVTP